MKIRNYRGFTLLETLNSVAIFCVLFILTFGIFDSGNRLWMVTDASASNQNEIRRAIADMEKKIRASTDFATVPGPGSNNSARFTFEDQTIGYGLVQDTARTGLRYYIQETIDGVVTRRLANDITALKFTTQRQDQSNKYEKVIIELTAQKTTLNGRTIEFKLKQIATRRNS